MVRSLQGPGRDNEPDPLVALARQIAGLRRKVDDATAQVLRMAGLRAEPDILRVLGSLVVEGDISVPSGVIRLAGVDQDIAAAIAALATAQSNIATLVSQQITGGAGSNVYNGSVGTGGVYASVSIPVPSGYTRAIVIGIGHGLLSGSPVALGLLTRIDGADGNQAPIVTSAAWMSGSCSSTRGPYAVSGSVTVSTVCPGASAGITGTIITSAQAIFLR